MPSDSKRVASILGSADNIFECVAEGIGTIHAWDTNCLQNATYHLKRASILALSPKEYDQFLVDYNSKRYLSSDLFQAVKPAFLDKEYQNAWDIIFGMNPREDLKHYLFKGFSALENIELASILSKKDLDKEILKNLGIQELVFKKIGKLSGGQQQRVSIARVLCKKPKIIFADEATGNLDKDNAQNVINILKDYVRKNKAALLFVTHDDKLASLCDEIYRFNKNGIY